MDHWRRGHKQICKEIHRGGNAEQYHADKKYKEAVAVAVEASTAVSDHDSDLIKEASRAEELLDDVARRTRRVFGESHPTTRLAETELEKARGISRMAPRTPAGQVLKETV